MKNFSTRCQGKIAEKGNNNNDGELILPCKKTLSFLTQFARVYHAEPLIRKKLCGFILN
jgi:hypothetical protein